MPWNDQMAQALAGAADLRTLLKFMFSKKAKKMMKSSSLIWRYVVNFKSIVKISSIFVAVLENMNFNQVRSN